jgi:arylsulfatase
VTAKLSVPESGAHGVLVSQGGGVGGWCLYGHEGRLKYCYNFFGIEYYYVTADSPVPPGDHLLRMEFAYDGGGLGKGGHRLADLTRLRAARQRLHRPNRPGEIDMGADDHAHLIAAEDKLNIAMPRQ